MQILNPKMLGAAAAAMFALASVPAQAWHYETVARAAHEVEDASAHVHRQAEDEYRHRRRRDAIAIRALHNLENVAAHFHRQVERYRDEARHTMHDFDNLHYAFEDARRAIYRSNFGVHVMRDWQRVEYAMRTLEREYLEDDHDDHRDPHDDDHWDRDRRRRDRFPDRDDRFPRRRRVF